MRSSIVSGIGAAALAFTMLACSSTRVEPPAPPIFVVRDVPPPIQEFRSCTLGESCLGMDERPFEPCWVDTTRCVDKIEEPILVERRRDGASPPDPDIEISRK